MVEQKDVFSSSPARTPKLELAAEWPSTGGCWNPPQKKIPYVQGQTRSHNKTVRVKIKPHTRQRTSKRAQKAGWICGPEMAHRLQLWLWPWESKWETVGIWLGCCRIERRHPSQNTEEEGARREEQAYSKEIWESLKIFSRASGRDFSSEIVSNSWRRWPTYHLKTATQTSRFQRKRFCPAREIAKWKSK